MAPRIKIEGKPLRVADWSKYEALKVKDLEISKKYKQNDKDVEHIYNFRPEELDLLPGKVVGHFYHKIGGIAVTMQGFEHEKFLGEEIGIVDEDGNCIILEIAKDGRRRFYRDTVEHLGLDVTQHPIDAKKLKCKLPKTAKEMQIKKDEIKDNNLEEGD